MKLEQRHRGNRGLPASPATSNFHSTSASFPNDKTPILKDISRLPHPRRFKTGILGGRAPTGQRSSILISRFCYGGTRGDAWPHRHTASDARQPLALPCVAGMCMSALERSYSPSTISGNISRCGEQRKPTKNCPPHGRHLASGADN